MCWQLLLLARIPSFAVQNPQNHLHKQLRDSDTNRPTNKTVSFRRLHTKPRQQEKKTPVFFLLLTPARQTETFNSAVSSSFLAWPANLLSSHKQPFLYINSSNNVRPRRHHTRPPPHNNKNDVRQPPCQAQYRRHPPLRPSQLGRQLLVWRCAAQ